MKWLTLLLALSVGCSEKAKPVVATPPPKPVPLAPLIAERVAVDGGSNDRETFYTVKPFAFAGEAAPASATRLEISGNQITLAGSKIAFDALKPRLGADVLLSFDADTYLAQVQELLALLDDLGTHVWLQSPDVAALAWPVKLKDEPAFAAWVDEPAPGKLRVVQRSDGFELQTNMGKLPGGDPKGPTVPLRGGSLDLVTLQKGLDQVKARFHEAPDLCFMPSFATTLRDATRAVASNWLGGDKLVFEQVCFVYPRPPAPKAAK